MGICELGGAVGCSCPDWIVTLAVIGGFIVYAIIGLLIFAIVKSCKDDIEWEWILFFIFLWPAAIILSIMGAVVWFIFRTITIIIMGVTKEDLVDLKDEIVVEVDNKVKHEDKKIMDYLKYEYKPSRKKKEDAKAVKSKSDNKGKKRKK